MLSAFLYGFIFCLGLIIPLGIQNIFIFNQGATQPHFYQVLPTIITAGFCDALLIILSVSGVSVIVLELPWLKALVYGLGFVFLLYMAYSTWTMSTPRSHMNIKPLGIKKQILFTISVSIFNPHAIIDSVAVIGSNSISFVGPAKIAYTIACISASFLWFFLLAFLGRTIQQINAGGSLLSIINKCSSLILLLVAGYLGYQLLHFLK